jgi:hypothetical protein
MGGETCNDDPTYTACDHALAELELLRFSYLDEGYSPEVIARWESEGCLDEIRRRLGYRVVVRAVEAPVSIAPGETLQVNVDPNLSVTCRVPFSLCAICGMNRAHPGR